MNPKSHTLFHFTSSLDNLLKILDAGFWPKYCQEDFRWYNNDLGYIAYPMVCFCDIPLTRITEHTRFYGRFGIGMKRDWAIRNGLNPVMYLTYHSPIRAHVLNFARQDKVYPVESDQKTHVDAVLNLISMIKPIDGYMEVGSPPALAHKEFYLENEWRYVPRLEQGRICIPIQNFRDSKDSYNDYTYKNCMLKFGHSDIEYIFVEDEQAINTMLDHLNSLVFSGKNSVHHIDLIKTKLLPLSQIERDF